MGISIDEEALFDVEEHVRANADLYPLLHACLTAQEKKHEHKTLKMSIYGAKGLRRQLHGKEGQVKVLKDEGEVAKKNDQKISQTGVGEVQQDPQEDEEDEEYKEIEQEDLQEGKEE